MIDNKNKIFAPSKVKYDNNKIEAYLRGERIFPTTIELDLTQLCSRSCPGCPYSVSRKPGLTLTLSFLDRLFSIIGQHTPGIILSGGESTLVPHFPEVAELAKKKGFKEIAVISNGANIHLPKIQDALLEYMTSIRISLYDWQEDINNKSFLNSLKKIEDLKNLIVKTGSKLEIGASILTKKEYNHLYEKVGALALNAGIDWLYFHPYCIEWEENYPTQADQTGVIEVIENFKLIAPKAANIQIPYERYSTEPLYFEKMHGSFFLIQIGADGVNYAGPESKYEKDSALLDLNEYMEDDFLWHPQRVNRLNEINSDNYRFIGTKHRPPMFSDYIQKIIDERQNNNNIITEISTDEIFSYPNII